MEQPLDFYEPDVLPATQPIVSKHYRNTTQTYTNSYAVHFTGIAIYYVP